MTWFVGIAVVLVLGTIAVVAAGRGGPLAPVVGDDPGLGVPAQGRLEAEDLRRVRFPLALRGYRMADVDALLDRLAREREQDRRDGPDRSEPAQPPGPSEPAAPEAAGPNRGEAGTG